MRGSSSEVAFSAQLLETSAHRPLVNEKPSARPAASTTPTQAALPGTASSVNHAADRGAGEPGGVEPGVAETGVQPGLRVYGPGELAALALPATVTWSTGIERAQPRTELASPRLLDRELYDAAPVRSAHRYPRQRNVHGLYFFRRTGQHIWHESLLEATVLRWLDMRADIVAISAQPMRIDFADGTAHTPDMLALHSDHTQVLYDVKPLRLLPKFREQFTKTQAFCKHVGFRYEIHHELPPQVAVNLSWIAGFKHPGYRPDPTVLDRLLAALDEPMPLVQAARCMFPRDPARGRSAVFHLVWSGVLALDLNHPISNRTCIERSSK